MKIGLIIFVYFILSSCGTNTPKKQHILFIGNSYTYRNKGVDQHLVSLAPQKIKQKNDIYRAAKGKYHLKTHYYDPITQEKFKEHAWNKVVLQEYSTGTMKAPSQFNFFGKLWAKKIRAKNPNAEIFLYSTWGYKNTQCMVDSIQTAYSKLATAIDATVIPVGKMWEEIQPKINLYDNTDNAHPNRKGTFLTACLFYEYLYEQDVRNTPHSDPKLPEWLQRKLKRLAHEFHEKWERTTSYGFEIKSTIQ